MLVSLRLPVDLSEATDYKLSYRFTLLDGKEGLGTFLVAQQGHLGAIINSEGGKGSGFEIAEKKAFENETSKPPFKLEKGATYVCEMHTRIAEGKVSATLHLSLSGEPPGAPYLTLSSQPIAALRWKPSMHLVERVVQGTGVPTLHAHFSRFTIEAVKVEVLQGKAKIMSWKQGPIVPMK